MNDSIEINDIIRKFYKPVDFSGDIFYFFSSYYSKFEKLVIGVEGASGSGKTIFTTDLATSLSKNKVVVISLDDYLIMNKEEMLLNGIETRYDWRTRDKKRFLEDIKTLRSGKNIKKPKQDFSLEAPSNEVEIIEPKPFIIIEGNLNIADVCDSIIFLFAPDDVLVERRFKRDIQKSMHNNSLRENARISLGFYHSMLETYAKEADFIFDTHNNLLYKKNSV
ncbi:MAG: hypothetical protein A2725_02210 [Candidatus Magasanikbacteria bacterium RIFCSPHIGHO2_01_FULL_33_34]|uniref:Phosphoribulokinase/uridine kinase domain-containing protein n=1 Tax=Candidatus Magasanikbacteria bacterium RIFCSPHIGHO2_01_FULL_33_34 TaxID=1798671 RepID=A0A1F6LKG1_9BACT|nr:MAG: hypothetical protein A2725_02210 [Candidatus Magasanikbacteria bacterium RIFCSPHIGHO2_01_FULL_33_34]OGH65581.1 MAG: hypothetical protein A3B83_01785 [Candidatus Magasanikbacteria bacterium RIFCSPHIGHO2_02_FULL_33_17]OGH76292.1 MAG: hypothetical protein A3A89_02605 [Candidatus Magasanikbacteria bacterium RIFCSPLOWO2_01_FULL_33_34]OGH81513.1 MAG: hypothetical protein A3F93_00970 [Candidatus Magasanikbacteria bacterium RIFCSPLOWO2_12_FULL_34_7]